MDHPKRGRCIILNYEKFDDQRLRERKGSENDARELQKTFTALNFDVVPYLNQNKSETMKIFDEGKNFYFILLSNYLINFPMM